MHAKNFVLKVHYTFRECRPSLILARKSDIIIIPEMMGEKLEDYLSHARQKD